MGWSDVSGMSAKSRRHVVGPVGVNEQYDKMRKFETKIRGKFFFKLFAGVPSHKQ